VGKRRTGVAKSGLNQSSPQPEGPFPLIAVYAMRWPVTVLYKIGGIKMIPLFNDEQRASLATHHRQASYLVCVTILFLSGCMTAAEHRAAVRADAGSQLTVGTVQREIRVGMPGSEVARILGSPNIVTTDENRREVWVYDKIATERVYSTSAGGVSALILGGTSVGGGIVGGAGGPSYSSSAGASSTNQRTLTIIIKYDEQMMVRDFSYHASSF